MSLIWNAVKNNIWANYFLLKVLMIIYFLYLLLCFVCFVAMMLAAAIFQSEWKLKFKQESRRLWMVLKTLTDGQATDEFERELSCCGYNNALDYCDRKSKRCNHNSGTVMLVTSLCWWHHHVFRYVGVFVMYFLNVSVTNISKLSRDDVIRSNTFGLQHPSPTSM